MEDEGGRRRRQRNQQDSQQIQETSSHPSSAILPSPEKLDESPFSRGQDATQTQKDFSIVWRWLTSERFLKPPSYSPIMQWQSSRQYPQLEPPEFNTLVQTAFGSAFDRIRNTFHPGNHEMVLLYYTGHGHPLPTDENASTSSRPNFELMFGPNNICSQTEDKLNNPNFARDHGPDFARDRRVRGGELCLHHFGYCDLRGLLVPWTAALEAKSTKFDGEKCNKHLVIILDSCYSGKFVEDLQELTDPQYRWNQNGCTVTVQSGCGSGQSIRGGIFTPCFITLMEDRTRLDQLESKWRNLSSDKRNIYCTLNYLPSPQVRTTMPTSHLLSKTPTIKFPTIQNFQLTLFKDPGFFRFCLRKLFPETFNRFREANKVSKDSKQPTNADRRCCIF